MTADDRKALTEALKEYRVGKSIPFKPSRPRTRKRSRYFGRAKRRK